jgi:hypothetical protein
MNSVFLCTRQGFDGAIGARFLALLLLKRQEFGVRLGIGASRQAENPTPKAKGKRDRAIIAVLLAGSDDANWLISVRPTLAAREWVTVDLIGEGSHARCTASCHGLPVWDCWNPWPLGIYYVLQTIFGATFDSSSWISTMSLTSSVSSLLSIIEILLCGGKASNRGKLQQNEFCRKDIKRNFCG